MPTRPHNLPAFTLLELVLVLAILAIIAGLAAPSLRGFATGRKAVNTATQLVTLTHWAHSQAKADGITYLLNLNTTANTFWLTTQDAAVAANSQRIQSDMGQLFHLPEGVRLESDAATDPTANGVSIIHFFPNGRTDPATICLRDASDTIEITAPSATENFRISSPKEAP